MSHEPFTPDTIVLIHGFWVTPRSWEDWQARYEAAGGQYFVCPICFNAKHLDDSRLIPGAEIQGTVPMWEWIGDEGATTFSY